jgi:diguanylate cyclase (GGDEF)-like protein/putative nucleotidyltransferase with HDIG domain/PAS domain S-box-containing protein
MNLVSDPPPTGHLDQRVLSAPPSNSAQSLLALLQLAGKSPPATSADDPLEGIIAPHVMRSLWSALQARDLTTVQHSRRVATLAVHLAEYLGWEGRQLRAMEIAALLHDIGKLGVPDHIRHKPGKLTPDERELMALHYNVALNVLQACRVDPYVLEMICNAQASIVGLHPSRQSWRQPSLGARILAVVDAYDSLITAQPWRSSLSHDDVLRMLDSSCGREFDANVVSALGRFMQLRGLPPTQEAFAGLETADLPPINGQQEAAWLSQVMGQLYLLESVYDGYFVIDADLRIVVWSRGAENLLGHGIFEMLGKTWTSRLLGYLTEEAQTLPEPLCPMHRVLHGAGPQASELQLERADGRVMRAELQSIPLLDEAGRLHGAVEILRDLTRCQRRAPQALRELRLAATRDALTSVANRRELETRLAEMMVHHERHPDEPFSVIFLDVDYFKNINDTHGHAVGDQVLIDIARLLQRETYSGEIVGRYGGEEFVILCPGTDLPAAVRRAERLRTAIRTTHLGSIELPRITASFGVAQLEPGDNAESLLRRADQALYHAKQTGRDRTSSGAIEPDEPDESTRAVPPSDPFVYTLEFQAVIAADLLVYKLGGFVNDLGVEVKEVQPDRVVLRHGQTGWFGRWGLRPESQPVEIVLRFDSTQTVGAYRQLRRIEATIRPRGRIRDPHVFQHRAQQILRELRGYFAAE